MSKPDVHLDWHRICLFYGCAFEDYLSYTGEKQYDLASRALQELVQAFAGTGKVAGSGKSIKQHF